MPAGWTKSRNRSTGQRGSWQGPGAANDPSLPPRTDLLDDPSGPAWMGWAWSDTASLDDADPPRDQGLYVIGAGTDIIYVGQSADLRSRITTHRRMLLSERRRSVRWVVTDDLSRAQLLEAECDLIASASLAAGAPPALQFGCSAERGSGPGAK